MGLLSSLFGSQPSWHRKLPPQLQFTSSDLIAELDELRKQAGLDDEPFIMAVSGSRTSTIRSIRLAYTEAKRQMPGHPESEYFGCAIGDRITKKMMALPYNNSPTALSSAELAAIGDDLESIAYRCKTLDDAIHFLIDIEDREGSFDDPFGLIKRIDAICSKFPTL